MIGNPPVGFHVISTHATTGVASIQLPTGVSSITINGNVYAATAGVITGVAVADTESLFSKG